MNRKAYLLSILTPLILLAGCMGYRLGGGRPAGIETVAVAPIINATGEPALELQITHALRERIQFDGRLKLVDPADAPDGIVEVSLTGYVIQPIAFRSEERTTPQIYCLRVDGKASLKRADTGTVIATSETYGEATFPFQSDLTSSKRDALPAAAAEIAKYMVDDLIEQW